MRTASLADDEGHTLVELSVYLVLTVLALGLALSATAASRRALGIWSSEAATTNALAGAASRVDADLRQTVALRTPAPDTWALSLLNGQTVTYQSVAERVYRDGRLLHPDEVGLVLHLMPPDTACRLSCLAHARLSIVQDQWPSRPSATPERSPAHPPIEWTVFLRPSPWASP